MTLEQAKEIALEQEKDAKARRDMIDNLEDYAKEMKNAAKATDAMVKQNSKLQKLARNLSQITNIPLKAMSKNMMQVALQSKNLQNALGGDLRATRALTNELIQGSTTSAEAIQGLTQNTELSAEQMSQFQGEFQTVYDYIQGELDKGLEAGEIDLTGMQDSLNTMLAMCGNNVEACKSVLAALGISAELEPGEMTTQEVDQYVPAVFESAMG